MRYRPFGVSGTVVSAVSLALTDGEGRRRAEDWQAIVYQGLESGVNAFEIVGVNPAILDGLSEGLSSIDRHLTFVALRIGYTVDGRRDFSAAHITRTVEATIARTGLGYLDLVLLDDPGEHELPAEAMAALKALRAAGRAVRIGVAGKGEALDAYISMGGFDVVSVPYSLDASWMDRRRVKAATEHDMAVIGYAFYPEDFHSAKDLAPKKKSFWGKPKFHNPLAGAGTYAFLHNTPGWTAEEICLSYVLTEPALATVQITTDELPRLADLAAVTERDMPPGLSSRIEMARFGPQGLAKGS